MDQNIRVYAVSIALKPKDRLPVSKEVLLQALDKVQSVIEQTTNAYVKILIPGPDDHFWK